MILTLSSLVAGDVLGRPTGEASTTAAGKRLAIGIMLTMVVVALLPRLTLWRLIELKMEVLVQCVPAFLLGLHMRTLRAGPVLGGLAVGSALVTAAVLLDFERVAGVHLGLIALGVNFAVCFALHSVSRRTETSAERGPA